MTDTFLIVWVLIWTHLLAFTLGQLCEVYLRHRDSRDPRDLLTKNGIGDGENEGHQSRVHSDH